MTSYFSKSPRKTLIATGLVIALAGSAGAVYAKGAMNQDRMAERFDYIFTQLSLTEAQRTSVVEVMTSQMDEMRGQRHEQRMAEGERPTQEERQAIRAGMQFALADELGTVLQADQVEGLMTYMDAHSPKGGRGRHEGRQGESRGEHGKRQGVPETDGQ